MLILEQKQTIPVILDGNRMNPEHLAMLSKKQIAALKLPINTGKEEVSLGDLCTVSGKISEDIRMLGDFSKVRRLGYGMQKGKLIIEGVAGDELGSSMQGGAILVHGNAGSWVGASMQGGYIEITGHAKHYLGGIRLAAFHGMNGGTIFLHKSCGHYAGDRMRRGLLWIAGASGSYMASRMLGGTIVSTETVGSYPGIGMKRGTLFLYKQPARWLGSFGNCGMNEGAFLTLLPRQLKQQYPSVALPIKKFNTRFERHMGDLSVGGIGEVFIAKQSA